MSVIFFYKFVIWLSFFKTFSWASQLIPLIDVRPTQDVLRMVQPSLKRDIRTLVLFLPYILLHTIISNDDNNFLMEEMLAVIGDYYNITVWLLWKPFFNYLFYMN